MKKLTAFLTAIITCAALFSCSKTEESSKSEKQPDNITAELIGDVAFKREKIEFPDSLTYIFRISPYNDGRNVLLIGLTNKGPAFYHADSSFSEFTEVEFPEFSFMTAYDIDILSDGTVVQLVNAADYGGLPDPNPYAEDYDAELYNENAVYTLMLREYSADGKLLSSVPVENLPFDTDDQLVIMGMSADKDSIIADINGTNYIIGRDGSFRGELSAGSDKVKILNFGKDKDGNICCAVAPQEDKLNLCRIDTVNLTLEEADITYGHL